MNKKKLISALLSAVMLLSAAPSFARRFGAEDLYEAETLGHKADDKVTIIEDSSLSGGKGLLLGGAQPGDYIYFQKVNIKQHGVYHIKVQMKTGPNYGKVQLVFPDINALVGPVIDLYSQTPGLKEFDLGEQVCNVSDSRWFRFDVVGKNDASTGYDICMDYLYLNCLREPTDIMPDMETPELLYGGNGDIPYEIGQVMEGGTGCSTHVVFHPTEQNLAYMGTDMGGLYRWQEETKSWKPLTDIFTSENFHYLGIDSIALAETAPNVIYIACGENTNKGEKLIGEVLKSTDYGETWTFTGLKEYFAANMDQRYWGECMAVDPVNPDRVILATQKSGLIYTTDGFKTWSNMATPEGSYPRIVTFDKNSAQGGVTQRIYCGMVGGGIYVSEDAGASWSLMPGAPENPTKIKIAKDGTLAVGTQESGLYRYKNGVWENISPSYDYPVKEGRSKQFWQVGIDPNNSDYMVTSWHWGPWGQYGEWVYYTTDGGKKWTLVNDNCYRDHQVPRCEWGGFFANVSDIAIDPYNPGRVFLAGWQNFSQTDNIFAETSVWQNYTGGVEHGCTVELITPTAGTNLLVSAYDYLGGKFTDPTNYCNEMVPPKGNNPPRSAVSLNNPNVMLRIGKNSNNYSTDGGISWRFCASHPAQGKDPTDAAISCDVNPETGLPVFVTSWTGEVPYVSFDMGETWIKSNGAAPSTSIGKWDTAVYLAADGKEPNVFYYVSGTSIYRSDDYGRNFTLITTLANFSCIRTAPGHAGHVYVSGGGKLYVSYSYGEMFREVKEISGAGGVGFGKEAPGSTYPTMYINGTIDGRNGIFRSTDEGKSWQLIYNKSDNSKIVSSGNLAGDMQNFGVVYFGSIGRGIHYAAPAGENPFINMRSDDVKVVINQQTVAFDVPAVIKDGRTMVPMRRIFEVVGATVTWDAETQTVKAVRKVTDNFGIEETTVELTIGKNEIIVNGAAQPIDTAPFIENGRTLVPARFVAQALGAKVEWIEEDRIVNIRI